MAKEKNNEQNRTARKEEQTGSPKYFDVDRHSQTVNGAGSPPARKAKEENEPPISDGRFFPSRKAHDDHILELQKKQSDTSATESPGT